MQRVSSEAYVERQGGFIDYVLWGDDGKPLAVVESKHEQVETFQSSHFWNANTISDAHVRSLTEEISQLPCEQEAEPLEARSFNATILSKKRPALDSKAQRSFLAI
ncbi:MAG: hypothetical protein ACKVLL_00400 [Verrucomicrobiales bacterium]